MKYLTGHNREWPKRFASIASYLRTFLPDACKIHHVGSTSVTGLVAKDIIDVDIEYTSLPLQEVIDARSHSDDR